MVSLEYYFRNLTQEDGIFRAPHASEKISYPEDGNEAIGQVESDSYWFRHRNRVLGKVINRYVKEKIFVDVGGGNGFVSLHLKEIGLIPILVEPGPAGCKAAKSRGLENVICGRLNDLDITPNSIPAIGAFDVVEHIDDDLAFIKMLFEALKPGGHMFLTVPAFQFLWSEVDQHSGHFRRYDKKSMELVCRKAGFKVVFERYFFGLLVVPIYLFRCLLPKIKPASKQGDVMESISADHIPSGKISSILLNSIWDLEGKFLEHGYDLPVGSSLIVVAQKPF